MTKLAKELTAGDKINPPQHERTWLWRDGNKRLMTVVSVADGDVDSRGSWLHVTASFESPYNGQPSEMRFSVRPETKVSLKA